MFDVVKNCSGLAYHTAQVRPGAAYFALRGATADGHTFVPQAIAAGARVIVAEEPVSVPSAVTVVVVPDTRVALGQCAARWFADPTAHLRLVGITGTNGKTTTTYLLESIWRAAGHVPGVMGTVNYRYGAAVIPAPTTTPESYDVQRMARDMVDHQVTDLAMEVSSHALAQHRVDACHFAGAVFTNLSQDHLDYHADMQDYRHAKQRLFAMLDDTAFAVINADDPAGREMATATKARVVWFGLGPDRITENKRRTLILSYAADEAVVHPTTWESTLSGTVMRVATPVGEFVVQSPLVGRFNVYNLLGAIAVAVAEEISVAAIQVGIATMPQVPGRLERVGTGGPAVFVDYAHSPDALTNVLRTLRPLTKGRLITVFGCGGDRDRSKRPLMGEAVARLSDLVVVTSDNPRTEDPQAIMAEILPGVERGGTGQVVQDVDRRRAIQRALHAAQPDDVVLIAGKGHEDYQIIGTTKHHFDDRDEVTKFFEKKLCHPERSEGSL